MIHIYNRINNNSKNQLKVNNKQMELKDLSKTYNQMKTMRKRLKRKKMVKGMAL